MSSRHHIPFPTNFLSLNTPLKKSGASANNVAVAFPESELPPHSFLSNQPHPGPRHSSVSSVSSVSSEASTASSASAPATGEPADSPVLKPALPAFLALNTKHQAPAVTAKEMSGVKSGFLSNRG